MAINPEFERLASDESINRTAQALAANNMATQVVASAAEAREAALSLIPAGAEVLTMQSVTLRQTGIAAAIDESGQYNSVRQALGKMEGREKKHLGAAPQYTIGSVHALTHEGHAVIASNTGSQLAAYASGAGHVIWIASTKKIVADLPSALKRIYEYTLPRESERLRAVFGVDSFVSKVLIVNREVRPERIKIILVKQDIGF